MNMRTRDTALLLQGCQIGSPKLHPLRGRRFCQLAYLAVCRLAFSFRAHSLRGMDIFKGEAYER